MRRPSCQPCRFGDRGRLGILYHGLLGIRTKASIVLYSVGVWSHKWLQATVPALLNLKHVHTSNVRAAEAFTRVFQLPTLSLETWTTSSPLDMLGGFGFFRH